MLPLLLDYSHRVCHPNHSNSNHWHSFHRLHRLHFRLRCLCLLHAPVWQLGANFSRWKNCFIHPFERRPTKFQINSIALRELIYEGIHISFIDVVVCDLIQSLQKTKCGVPTIPPQAHWKRRYLNTNQLSNIIFNPPILLKFSHNIGCSGYNGLTFITEFVPLPRCNSQMGIPETFSLEMKDFLEFGSMTWLYERSCYWKELALVAFSLFLDTQENCLLHAPFSSHRVHYCRKFVSVAKEHCRVVLTETFSSKYFCTFLPDINGFNIHLIIHYNDTCGPWLTFFYDFKYTDGKMTLKSRPKLIRQSKQNSVALSCITLAVLPVGFVMASWIFSGSWSGDVQCDQLEIADALKAATLISVQAHCTLCRRSSSLTALLATPTLLFFLFIWPLEIKPTSFTRRLRLSIFKRFDTSWFFQNTYVSEHFSSCSSAGVLRELNIWWLPLKPVHAPRHQSSIIDNMNKGKFLAWNGIADPSYGTLLSIKLNHLKEYTPL